MANSFFRFKHFVVHHDRCAMKVTTDACLFGAWVSASMGTKQAAAGMVAGVALPRLLDIGTGTGLLSLLIAQKVTGVVEAVEIATEAAAQAAENCAASPFGDRITVIPADLRQWKPRHRFDTIVCNPPFYQNSLKSGKKAKDQAHHDEGLLLPELLRFVQEWLTEDGSFYLLLPASRQAELSKLLLPEGLSVEQLCLVQQTTHHKPFRMMVQGGRQAKPAETQILSIRDEKGNYTPAFTALLKDYYLYL